MSDQILSKSAYTAVINAPIDRVDIADWLLNLPEGRVSALRSARPHRGGLPHYRRRTSQVNQRRADRRGTRHPALHWRDYRETPLPHGVDL
jgi:hypothetical protein